jgi:hypothetical protein
MTELANIQKWLTSIIIKPGRLADKIKLADDFYQLDNEKVIRASSRLSASDKIGIYARGYVFRLMDCLTAEYPTLRYLLGEELFGTFATAYLVNQPSTSPDLYDLGKNFAAFLKASQPKDRAANNTDPDMFDLPVELARLERALSEASRSRGLEGKENNSAAADQLLHFFGSVAFKTSPCLQLLQLQFPLVDFVQAVQHNEEAQTPEKKDSYIAISRKNYRVNLHEVEPWQWNFLNQLQATGNYRKATVATAQLGKI